MSVRFTVLASGSGGNASLVQVDGFGALIDVGLGPRQLGDRLRACGLSWSAVQAVLLTHTHTDHWKDRTLAFLRRKNIPLYCHPAHHPVLLTYSPAFGDLLRAGLVRSFEARRGLTLAAGLRFLPLPVRHDSGATFGFRVEGSADLFGRAIALGYVADLGCWDEPLADHLRDVDLLAVEFNHDVELERSSGRTPRLIARVLGDEGHLSNDQGAALVRTVLRRSSAERLQHLVQLHLSRECNRPALARQAARPVLSELAGAARLHTANQDLPGATLRLRSAPARRRARAEPTPRPPAGPTQLWLPGMGNGACEGPPTGASG